MHKAVGRLRETKGGTFGFNAATGEFRDLLKATASMPLFDGLHTSPDD